MMRYLKKIHFNIAISILLHLLIFLALTTAGISFSKHIKRSQSISVKIYSSKQAQKQEEITTSSTEELKSISEEKPELEKTKDTNKVLEKIKSKEEVKKDEKKEPVKEKNEQPKKDEKKEDNQELKQEQKLPQTQQQQNQILPQKVSSNLPGIEKYIDETPGLFAISARQKFNLASQISGCYRVARMESNLSKPSEISVSIKITDRGFIEHDINNTMDSSMYDYDSSYRSTVEVVKKALTICSPLRNIEEQKEIKNRYITLVFNNSVTIKD